MKSKTNPCPDSQTLCGFVEGSLEESEKNLIIDHLQDCDLCLEEISILKKTLSAAEGPLTPVPGDLKQKALKVALEESGAVDKIKSFTEFIFSLSNKGITFITNLILPEDARFQVLRPSPAGAGAFRDGDQRDQDGMMVEKTFGDITVKIVFIQEDWPSLHMKVRVKRKDTACINKRVSLYLENSLLSSKVTSPEGIVEFPDISLGYYAVKIPQEAIDLRLRFDPGED